VLEQGQAVFAVFGFDGLAGELDPRPFQQQQRTAEVGDGVAQFGVLDTVERLFELLGFLFKGGLLLLVAGRTATGQQQCRTQADAGPRGTHIHHLEFSCPTSLSRVDGLDTSRKTLLQMPLRSVFSRSQVLGSGWYTHRHF
jgi:hypothetical protein